MDYLNYTLSLLTQLFLTLALEPGSRMLKEAELSQGHTCKVKSLGVGVCVCGGCRCGCVCVYETEKTQRRTEANLIPKSNSECPLFFLKNLAVCLCVC